MIDLMPHTLKSSRLICPMAKRLDGGARRSRASNAFIRLHATNNRATIGT
jgi:hypothetical protein